MIIQTTDEAKVSIKTTKQRKLFVKILEYEYKTTPRESIVGRLTKYSQEKRNRDQKRINAKKTSKKNSPAH